MCMEKVVHRIVISIIVCAICCSWADASWSTLGGNSARQGQSTNPGPKRGCLKWVHGAPGPVAQGAVVGATGTVYYATTNGVLTALDPDGQMLWECLLGDGEMVTVEKVDGAIVSTATDYTGDWDALVISAGIDPGQGAGDLMQLGPTKLCIVELDGVEVLSFRYASDTNGLTGDTPITDGIEVMAVIPAGARNWQDIQLYIDGVIETNLLCPREESIPREISAVNILCENAQVKVYKTPEKVVSYPTIGPDGTIYVGFGDKLYAIGADGVIDWDYETDAFIYSCPAVDDQGRIFFGSADGNVYALNPDGTKLWHFPVPGPGQVGGSVLAPPSIGKDGSIYIAGMYNSILYALNPVDGGIEWQCDLSGGEDNTKSMITAPVVAPDGTIYATVLDDTNLYAIDPNNGEIEWSTDISHKPELVGYWKLNEQYGEPLHDSSAYSRNGTFTYREEWDHIRGVLGGGLQEAFMQVDRLWFKPGYPPRTISMWFRFTDYDLGTLEILILQPQDSFSAAISFFINDVNGAFRLSLGNGYITGQTDLRDNQWHHIAVVMEHSEPVITTQNTRIYIDGQLDASYESNGGYSEGVGVYHPDYGEPRYRLEARGWEAVDDLRFYETALTQEQIQELMWDETAPVFTELRPAENTVAKGLYCWSEVAVGPDGTIYAGFDDPYLRAINPDGTVKWIKHLACGGNYTLSVGPDNLVYAAGADGVVYVIREDGRLISRFDMGKHVTVAISIDPHPNFQLLEYECQPGYPVIDKNGTVFVSDTGGKIWAISADDCDGRRQELTCQKWIMDITDDCIVNLADFAVIAGDWLACTELTAECTPNPEGPWYYVPGYDPGFGQYLDADINQDTYVSFDDIAWLMRTWLMGGDIDY